MKQIYNLIFTGVFFAVALLILPTPTNADTFSFITNQIVVDNTDVNPDIPDTIFPATPINLSINFDKSSYALGETMTMTTTASFGTCANRPLNILVTAQIQGQPATLKTIFTSNVSESTPTIQTKTFTAPAIAGNYNMLITITVKTTDYYRLWSHDSYTSIFNNTLALFKDDVINWLTPKFFVEFQIADLIADIRAASDVYKMNTAFHLRDPFSNTFAFGQPGGTVILNTSAIMPFVVAPPATVDVVVNNQQGPITLNTGNDVEVTWATSPSVSWCTCTCRDPKTNIAINCGSSPDATTSCGGAVPQNNINNIGTDIKSTPFPIPSVVRHTKFDVHCE